MKILTEAAKSQDYLDTVLEQLVSKVSKASLGAVGLTITHESSKVAIPMFLGLLWSRSLKEQHHTAPLLAGVGSVTGRTVRICAVVS